MTLTQLGPNRVQVAGAKGYAPTSSYKVCVTYDDGWRSVAMQPIVGFDATAKAERQTAAILERTREMLRDRNLADWRRTHVEIIGAESSYGARARHRDSREVIAKIVVEHDEKRAVDLFWREQCSAIMTMSVGTAIGLASPVMPITHLFSFPARQVQGGRHRHPRRRGRNPGTGRPAPGSSPAWSFVPPFRRMRQPPINGRRSS